MCCGLGERQRYVVRLALLVSLFNFCFWDVSLRNELWPKELFFCKKFEASSFANIYSENQILTERLQNNNLQKRHCSEKRHTFAAKPRKVGITLALPTLVKLATLSYGNEKTIHSSRRG
jgi:hypothetical protein